jgi:hypothetical protein
MEQMVAPADTAPHTGTPGDLNDELINTDVWTDQMVQAAGIPIFDVPLVSVGGGLGSFILTQLLRISGVPTQNIKVLTVLDYPYQTYRFLATNSQIPATERLRSDSASEPDNIWGWPSYAFREAFDKRFKEPGLRGFIGPIWQVATEPILTDYWTPRSGQVFASLDREAARIRWNDMLAKGQVRLSRRRYGGGYFTILTPAEGTYPTKRIAFRSTYVHLSVGYPGFQLLPDLQAYRDKYDDYFRMVGAYEPHDNIYEELKRRPCTVVVRGSGIVAIRILHRIYDDRRKYGAQTQVLHLFRNYVGGPQGDSILMRRPGKNGWAYQGFNFCKAGWGGITTHQQVKLPPEKRPAFVQQVGGTNIPRRKFWLNMLEEGTKEGWYRIHTGEVDQVERSPDGQHIITRIRDNKGGVLEIPADFVIDGTGLYKDIREHRYIADLLDHSGAGQNPGHGLDVDYSFEVKGTRNAPGKMYAMGTSTGAGSHFAANDSFLGLQWSGLYVMDDLAREGFCKRLNFARATSQWIKWARNTQI